MGDFFFGEYGIINCTKSNFCAVDIRASRVVPPHARVAFYVRRKASVFLGAEPCCGLLVFFV